MERERRRDSERQMADADASHRREAMMMGLMERAAAGRRGDRDRSRGRGRGCDASSGSAVGGLDARDILGVLLGGVAAERKGRRRGRREGRGGDEDDDDVDEEGGGAKDKDGGRDGGLKGALDALSRRVDEMVLSDREKGRRAAATPGRKMKQGAAPRVKFDGAESSPAASSRSSSDRNVVDRPSGGNLGGNLGGKITFSRRGKDGGQGHDADGEETSGTSVGGGGKGRRRGRTLRRDGSTTTSAD